MKKITRFFSGGLFVALVILLSGLLPWQVAAQSDKNVITIETKKEIGVEIKLKISAEGSVTIKGVKDPEKFQNGKEIVYRVDNSKIQIEGNVTDFQCRFGELSALFISNHTSIVNLVCNNNKLTKLDASNCEKLESLKCYNNRLEALNVSGCTSLKELDASNNTISETNFAKCQSLVSLICSENSLAEINLEDCRSLEEARLQENALKGLDVSNNKALKKLSLHTNFIQGDRMRTLVNSLPERDNKNRGELVVVNQYGDNNVCLVEDVEIAKNRKWDVLNRERGFYPGRAPIGNGVTRLIFDESVEVGRVINLNIKTVEGDFDVEGAWVKSATSWNSTYVITSKELVIKGDLLRLSCNRNDLKSVDITACPTMSSLDCSVNKLTSLKISPNSSLTRISCYSNQLVGEEMVDMLNNLPDLSSAPQKGELYVINTKAQPRDKNVCTPEDIKIPYGRGWIVYDQKGNDVVEFPGRYPLSVASDMKSGSVKLYPNPARAFLNIEGLPVGTMVHVYSLLGERLLSAESSVVGKMTLDVSSLPRGVYLLSAGETVFRVTLK